MKDVESNYVLLHLIFKVTAVIDSGRETQREKRSSVLVGCIIGLAICKTNVTAPPHSSFGA